MSTASIDDVTKQLAKTSVAPIHEVSFKGRGLKLNKAEDAKEIVEAIEKSEQMTSLQMMGNTMGVEAAEVISKALAKHPEFERARWSDMFTGRLKSEIPKALKHLGEGIIGAGAQLVELDLSDNAFGPNGVQGLVDLIKSSSCYTLQELRLNNNGLGITGGKMLASSLLDCHKSSCAAGRPLALRVFISGRNRLENEGATKLAEVFKAIGTLEELAMPQNGITHPGISALADAVAVNKRLRVLNLNDNTFTERGAKAIAKALPKLDNLEVINFGDCLLRNEGAKAIGKVLNEGHRKLKELILSGNEIGSTGASSVAESLEDKKHLVKLDLNANMLGEDGIELVQGAKQVVGKENVLASFSDDEGCDEEEDEDEEEEEEEAEDDEEGELNEDPGLQVKGQAVTPVKQVSAAEFLAFPSPTKLLGMGQARAAIMKQQLGYEIEDVERVVETVMRVAAVVRQDDDKTKDAAVECADALLEGVMKRAYAASQVANAILVQLGLIKGEDKKFKPMTDISGALIVLDHVVQQSYFPKQAREILQVFISKPGRQFEKCSQAQHKLLQTLYAF
ncbi:ran GTPase-activating protein 1-like [Haliotis rubra]|uniref:ran GTPase-activating protein 1-like n=1 Tax=Haliotis rubra TaxID=36100 RepID=UPI001EE50819|nr:ran GTPase-activating protein 1-like [Haliotis rubra]